MVIGVFCCWFKKNPFRPFVRIKQSVSLKLNKKNILFIHLKKKNNSGIKRSVQFAVCMCFID